MESVRQRRIIKIEFNMFIISNNCGGGYIYQIKKECFNNPFIWSLIFADEMIKFIKDFNEIDFTNINLIRLTKEIAKKNNYEMMNDTICGINIDKKINTYYTHYLFGNYQKPTSIGCNTYYNKNFEFVYNKYNERTNRMLELNEKPSFFIMGYKRYGWDNNKILQLLNLETNFNIVILYDKEFTETNGKHLIVLDSLNEKFYSPDNALKEKQEEIFSNLGI